MDPDANLEEQIEIATLILEDPVDSIYPEDITRLAEFVIALDRWIISGGFLPNKWRKSQNDT